MARHTIQVEIKGISALLMHAFPLVPIEAIEKKSASDQAEVSAYRDPNSGMLYIPGDAIQRCLIAAAAYSKGKGRASLQKTAAACLFIAPERASTARREYTIDSRPVVVPATKGRVMRHRPRLDDWGIEFEIEFDPDLITATQLRRIVDDAGALVGLLDYRPEKKGPFGRFMVTRWDDAGNGNGKK